MGNFTWILRKLVGKLIIFQDDGDVNLGIQKIKKKKTLHVPLQTVIIPQYYSLKLYRLKPH